MVYQTQKKSGWVTKLLREFAAFTIIVAEAGAYVAAQRVSLSGNGGAIQIAYTNPTRR